MSRLGNRKYAILLVISIGIAVLLFVIYTLTRSGAVNPYKDNTLTAEAGRDFAALYRHGDLYTFVNQNENVMSQIRADLLLFARSTRPEFSHREKLVGFTFDKKISSESNTAIYTGYYYGLRDKIELRLTSHGRGVYTLSITNLKDKTNIDAQLGMNGPRNRFIVQLPIEEDHYSIRYQLTEDRIVVSFYDGYTLTDVSDVENILEKGLGDKVADEVFFTLNRFGAVSIDELKNRLR